MSCRLLLLLLVMSPLIGCGPSDPYPIPAKLPTEPLVEKKDGQEYEFPPTVDFDGTTWIRVKEDPTDNVPAKAYVYASNDRDDYLFYMLYKPNELKSHGFPIEKQLMLAKMDPKTKKLFLDGPTELSLGGGMLLKAQFANQQKVGQEELYYADGNLLFRGHTIKDRLHGECTYFYKDGKPLIQGKFSGGHLLKASGFDPDGTETEFANKTDLMQFLAERLNK